MSDIVPPKKPKQYLKTLNLLNSKAAANTLSPKTYADLVGQFASKAYDNNEISFDEYMGIMKPLFGEAGEMITEKIKKYEDMDNYASGGRVGFENGTDKDFNRNPSGKNQFTGKQKPVSLIASIIDKYPNFRAKDFRGEGKLNNPKMGDDFKGKLLTKDDLLRAKAEGIEPKVKGKIKFKDVRGDQNLKASQFYKSTQGGAISMDKINNFAHYAPKLLSYLTSTADTGPLKAKVNRAAEGYDKKALVIAEKQEKLIKEKPKGWKLKLDAANAEARKTSIEANKNLPNNLKGTLGYFVVSPTGEFKLKGVDRAKTFAGISGEKQEYKKMDPSQRAAFGPTQSKVQGVIDLIKSKFPNVKTTRASNLPLPPKTVTANMFKTAFKGAPGPGGDIKDPLGGPDLINVKKYNKNPYDDVF